LQIQRKPWLGGYRPQIPVWQYIFYVLTASIHCTGLMMTPHRVETCCLVDYFQYNTKLCLTVIKTILILSITPYHPSSFLHPNPPQCSRCLYVKRLRVHPVVLAYEN
jgi:hypothetical protein